MLTKVLDKPDIWQIHVELPQNPLRNLNSYIICTSEGNLIIDTGFNRPECSHDLWAGIDELGLDLSKTALFITHLHSDHSGLVQEFVDRDCTVYMGEIDYNYLAGDKEGPIWPYLEALFLKEGMPADIVERQATENQARMYAPKSMFPAVLVRDQAILQLGDLEVLCLHTPGHTPGHMALYLPQEQVLFSGDHILFGITPNIGIWKDVSASLSDYLENLKKLKDLPVRLTLPAHRASHKDVYQRIDELVAHHQERLEEIYQVVASNPGLDAYGVAGKIHWSVRGKTWDQFPPHQRWFAMSETLAHLYYLVNTDRIMRQEDGETMSYYITEQKGCMELHTRIEQLLGEQIRPMLQSHGGNVRLTDCQEGIVYVELLGSCAGCPSADLSTRQFMEDTLKAAMPEISKVELSNSVDQDMLDFARKLLRHENP